MTEAQLEAGLLHSFMETNFAGIGTRYRGKVRDTYRQGDRLVLVTTDRISAFDHVLRQTIPFKGQVLNRLAAHFFERTHDVMPNHVQAVPHGNVTVARYAETVPIEFVVRGYLAGHSWRVYREGGRELCGVTLPEGLRQNSPLPSPILTPATKAAEGHDEDIRPEEIIARGLLSRQDLAFLTDRALALFHRGSTLAEARGLLLVDTKFEFGRLADGSFLVIDEILTPDSSRYFYAEGYEQRLGEDAPQRQLSKEFVREWLMAQGFQGHVGQILPDLPDSFRREITHRYVELYETLTGEIFEPDLRPLEETLAAMKAG